MVQTKEFTYSPPTSNKQEPIDEQINKFIKGHNVKKIIDIKYKLIITDYVRMHSALLVYEIED